ncbi:DNA-binding transcriptional MerR regulator [Nocardioides cavernae]|uniref:DNA-binding transcriptional MerR regulator n=1 Tax=Nocardioides cavernae TaxID=1921566 RepID=A0A7Y9H013_9ACTN|nr:MerR family transcriptional regulator [Nocardioides cavernae]NYE35423.1 DNA-binding transcriptional MerR regulator [Nocardioides cavernae]
MYTVGRASELTGVPSGTLRKWEQRYGVVVPQRSPGNYRLYDDEAVRRLSVMRSLVDAGWTAQEAARHVVDDVAAAEAQVERPEEPAYEAHFDTLVACAQDFDVPRLERLLVDGFASPDLASVVDDWLLPSMVHLGRAWQRGHVSVAGEHFVTAAVHRRLAQVFQSLHPAPSGGPRVVVGLPRGARHELGVLAFAMVLRARGVAVTYLGGDLPLEAWVGAVRLIAPDAAVLAAPTLEDLPATREVVEAMAPMTRVLVGGAFQAEVGGAHHLGHLAGSAASALARELGAVS